VPAIVLLTDGRQSGAPVTEVQRAAAATRTAGIDVYTVGLGADVDGPLLAEIAGRPNRAYIAPDEADLAQIYRDIARAIPCR
jgi:Mg-chelatase subunit ChlD